MVGPGPSSRVCPLGQVPFGARVAAELSGDGRRCPGQFSGNGSDREPVAAAQFNGRALGNAQLVVLSTVFHAGGLPTDS